MTSHHLNGGPSPRDNKPSVAALVALIAHQNDELRLQQRLINQLRWLVLLQAVCVVILAAINVFFR